MHPPLHRPHPDCQEVIHELLNCHDENPYAKFFGVCNDQKRALDQCFRREKNKQRKENLKQARASRQRYEAALERKKQLQENSC